MSKAIEAKTDRNPAQGKIESHVATPANAVGKQAPQSPGVVAQRLLQSLDGKLKEIVAPRPGPGPAAALKRNPQLNTAFQFDRVAEDSSEENMAFANEVAATFDRVNGRTPKDPPLSPNGTPDEARAKIKEVWGVRIRYGWIEGRDKPLQSDLKSDLQIPLPRGVSVAQARGAGFEVEEGNFWRATTMKVPQDEPGGERLARLLNETGSNALPWPTDEPGYTPEVGAAFLTGYVNERSIEGQPDSKALLRQSLVNIDPVAEQSRWLQAQLDASQTGSIPGVALIRASNAETVAGWVPLVKKPLIPDFFLAVPLDAAGIRTAAAANTWRDSEGHAMVAPLHEDDRRLLPKNLQAVYDDCRLNQGLVTAQQIALDLAEGAQVFRQRGASNQRLYYPTEASLKRGTSIDPSTPLQAKRPGGHQLFQFVNIHEAGKTPPTPGTRVRPPEPALKTPGLATTDLRQAITGFQESPNPRKEKALRSELDAANEASRQHARHVTPEEKTQLDAARNQAQAALADEKLLERSQAALRDYPNDYPDKLAQQLKQQQAQQVQQQQQTPTQEQRRQQQQQPPPGRVNANPGPDPAENPRTPAPPRPKLLTPAQKAAGELSHPFNLNINAYLRETLDELRSAGFSGYPVNKGENQLKREVDNVLRAANIATAAPLGSNHRTPAENMISIAKASSNNPRDLAIKLVEKTQAAKDLVAGIGPRNPVFIDGSKDPISVALGTKAVTELLSTGTKIDSFIKSISIFDPEQKTINSYDISINPKFASTSVHTDLDGVFAGSYGMTGLDIKVPGPHGGNHYIHVSLENAIKGTPVEVTGIVRRSDRSLMNMSYQDEGGSLKVASVPISPENANVVERALAAGRRIDEVRPVEGLAARLFSADSVAYFKQVSQTNGRGGEFARGVVAPNLVANTFGSMGQATPWANAAELVTSWLRSLPPELRTSLPPGMIDLPNVTIYSGGSAKTFGDNVAVPFGMSARQAQGLHNAARKVPEIIDKLATKYGLSEASEAARRAWHATSFKNSDIPSIILPTEVLEEMQSRGNDTHLGKTLPDLRQEIESTFTKLIRDLDMGDFIALHHTPTPPSGNDVLGPNTTEWQAAVKGQKAMAVYDDVAARLKSRYNFDLPKELEKRGYDNQRLRAMGVDELIHTFSTVARPIIESRGLDLGKIIVAFDTLQEKSGRLSGSDVSMLLAARALARPGDVYAVQVDTGGGRPTGERLPAYELGRDANGLVVVRPSVNPNGVNGDSAPNFYISSAAATGNLFRRAYERLMPLLPEEFRPNTAAGKKKLSDGNRSIDDPVAGKENPSAKRSVEEITAGFPPEFWTDAWDPGAAAQRYGLLAEQLAALRAFEPDKAALQHLSEYRFASSDQAAAAVYQLIERAFARNPGLQNEIEMGGVIYPDGNGGWRVTLPVMGQKNAVATGLRSRFDPAGALDYHVHPAVNSKGEAAVNGFSLGDLLYSLRIGTGGYVYQRGRAYKMELASDWASMPEDRKLAVFSSITNLRKALGSAESTALQQEAALDALRQRIAALPLKIVWYERTGVDSAASGADPQSMPIGAVVVTPAGRRTVEVYPQAKLGPPSMLPDFDLQLLRSSPLHKPGSVNAE